MTARAHQGGGKVKGAGVCGSDPLGDQRRVENQIDATCTPPAAQSWRAEPQRNVLVRPVLFDRHLVSDLGVDGAESGVRERRRARAGEENMDMGRRGDFPRSQSA